MVVTVGEGVALRALAGEDDILDALSAALATVEVVEAEALAAVERLQSQLADMKGGGE